MEQQKDFGISHKYLTCLHRLKWTNTLAYFPKKSAMKKKTHLISEKDIVSVECTLSFAETPQSEKFFSLKNAWKTEIVTSVIIIPEIFCFDTGRICVLSIGFTWRPWQIFHLLSINTFQCKIIINGVKELLKRTKKSISHHKIEFCVSTNMCLFI